MHPRHPERICWGGDKHCPVAALECGNGYPISLKQDVNIPLPDPAEAVAWMSR